MSPIEKRLVSLLPFEYRYSSQTVGVGEEEWAATRLVAGPSVSASIGLLDLCRLLRHVAVQISS